ncbi:MAG: DHHA1 domain-containing protein, partial [Planctomycetota bacterium]
KASSVNAARHLAEEATGAIIVGEIPAGADRQALLAALDTVRGTHAEAAILLAGADLAEGKVAIVANVPKPLVGKGLKAGDWVRETSAVVGGKGGGRPDAAQGGGTEPEKLADALERARAFASEHIGTA